jgi:hypothetical protein
LERIPKLGSISCRFRDWLEIAVNLCSAKELFLVAVSFNKNETCVNAGEKRAVVELILGKSGSSLAQNDRFNISSAYHGLRLLFNNWQVLKKDVSHPSERRLI